MPVKIGIYQLNDFLITSAPDREDGKIGGEEVISNLTFIVKRREWERSALLPDN